MFQRHGLEFTASDGHSRSLRVGHCSCGIARAAKLIELHLRRGKGTRSSVELRTQRRCLRARSECGSLELTLQLLNPFAQSCHSHSLHQPPNLAFEVCGRSRHPARTLLRGRFCLHEAVAQLRELF